MRAFDGTAGEGRYDYGCYDDAIHGITGKAGNGRIFSISSNYDTYRAFLEENKVVFLNDTDMPLLSEKIQNMPEKIGVIPRNLFC